MAEATDFLSKLKTAHTGYESFSGNFRNTPAGDIDAELLDRKPTKFSFTDDSTHGIAGKQVRETSASHAATKSAIEAGGSSVPAAIAPAEITALTTAAHKAETELHTLMQEHVNIGKKAEEVYLAEMRAIKGTGAAEVAARNTLQTEFKAFKELHNEHGAVIAAERTAISEAAGTKMIGGSATAAREVEAAAGAAVSSGAAAGAKIFVNTTAAEKLGVIGEKAFKDKTWAGKIAANVKANVNVASIEKGVVTESKLLGKGMKVGGAALGLVIGGYGLKDAGQVVGLIGPDTDEQGKTIPVDGSKIFKAAAELGVAAAATYYTVLKGGKAANILAM